MGEEFSTQVKHAGQPAFPVDTETANSAASSAEETTTDQTPSVEGEQTQTDKKAGGEDKGFLDHPRWTERENDWKQRFNSQEQRHLEEIQKLREEFAPKPVAKAPENMPVDIPSWFGGDAEQWQQYREWFDSQKDAAAEAAYNRLTEAQKKEQSMVDEATKFFDAEVAAIETDKELNPQNEKVDKNKLLKFAEDNDLVDSKGRWNYKAAFKMMKAADVFKMKDVISEKKKLASATTSENRAEEKTQPFKTSNDFQKPGARPW